ncbi:MAG: helix-turn-helix domain-containing protein [Parcubacteria group bacterium]|nr:helix-turn-helix domain-containing protein [Parcubacteria group bacterium]
MAKFEKKLTAHALRRQGMSIRAIAEHLMVSKSTVSLWCRDLPLTARQHARLLRNAARAGHVGRLRGAQVNHEKKEALMRFYIHEGRRRIGGITKRDVLIAGIALYWAEGNKKGKFGLTNSDPYMIQFVSQWLQLAMKVKKEDFMPRIFINGIHRPRIRKVLRFWSKLLHLPTHQFGKSVFLKRNPKKIYENYDSYYGLVALQVRKSSALKYRVLGLINALRDAGVA